MLGLLSSVMGYALKRKQSVLLTSNVNGGKPTTQTCIQQFVEAEEDEEADEWEVQEKLDDAYWEQGGPDAFSHHLQTLLNEAEEELEEGLVGQSVEDRVKYQEAGMVAMRSLVEQL